MKFAYGTISGRIAGVRQENKAVIAALVTHEGMPVTKVVAYGRTGEALAGTRDKAVIISGELSLIESSQEGVKRAVCINADTVGIGDGTANAFAIAGCLGKDPEIKYLESGITTCSFSLAVDRGRDSVTSWFDIKTFNKKAEVVSSYVKKGNYLAVYSTTFRWEQWEKEKVAYFKPSFTANQVALAARSINASQDTTPATATPASSAPASATTSIDEVPF